jgi:hypothetical protein
LNKGKFDLFSLLIIQSLLSVYYQPAENVLDENGAENEASDLDVLPQDEK